ncbi:Limb region 1 protein [Apodemus speciosus]|uniref:Limb region 1 protein n=1 Tax=Apodemus speciosus TaxID=105296 RepID=A0ABQ0ER29_APOSI
MEGQDEVSAREQHFHSQVRESTICFLIFAILYIISYFIITRYKRKSDEQEDEDAVVNRISVVSEHLHSSGFSWCCFAFTFSIISNEILLAFPQNYYIQWLNGSLIHGFLCVALAVPELIHRPGWPRTQKSTCLCLPSAGTKGVRHHHPAACLWNLASLFSNLCLFVLMPFAFFFLESEGFAGLKKEGQKKALDPFELQLQEIVNCCIEVGIRARILETLVMLLLLALLIFGMVWVASALIDSDAASTESLYVCTPVGLSRMFTVMGQLLVKPAILEDLDEQIYMITLEEQALQRRLHAGSGNYSRGLSSSVGYNITELEQELENVKTLKTKLERRKKASAWERNLVYPAVMILLLIETSISVLLVACNILCLLVDETAMPKGTRSLRFFGNFTPKKDDTTMTKIIGNCVSILVLSSALPVMSRTLVSHKEI